MVNQVMSAAWDARPLQGRSHSLCGLVEALSSVSILFTVQSSRDNLEPSKLRKSLEASLRRVDTDYFDLYMPHYWNNQVPIKDTMQELNKAVDEGLVKNIGVSNFRVDHLQQAMAASNYPIAVNQVHYNLLVREIEHEGILSFCQENDMIVNAWRPIQKAEITKNNQPDIIVSLMKKYDKTAAQIYINWLISQPNVVTLSKTTNIRHLEENLGAVGWTMEPDDIETLRHDYPYQLKASDAVPLR